MLGAEFCQHLGLIRAAAQNHCVSLVEFLLGVTKLGRFRRSTRRQRLHEKIHQRVFTAKIFERNGLTLVRGQIKGWSDITGLQHDGRFLLRGFLAFRCEVSEITRRIRESLLKRDAIACLAVPHSTT